MLRLVRIVQYVPVITRPFPSRSRTDTNYKELPPSGVPVSITTSGLVAYMISWNRNMSSGHSMARTYGWWHEVLSKVEAGRMPWLAPEREAVHALEQQGFPAALSEQPTGC